MKVKKINSINIGSFKSFSWQSSLSDFNDKVNVFLGWNGSGKTIISRILRSYELGNMSEKLDEATFSIGFDSGSKNNTELSGLSNKIRVFNEDYIQKILSQGHLDYVVALGESEVDFSIKEKDMRDTDEQFGKIHCKNEHDEIAQDVALNIIKPIAGMGHIKKELEPTGMYNSYSSSSFIKRFDWIHGKIENEEKKIEDLIKTEKEINNFRESLANQGKQKEEYQKLKKWNDWIFAANEKGGTQLDKINAILKFLPIYESSDKISKHADWSPEGKWIREGIGVHKLRNSEDAVHQCLFCNSEILNSDELLKHFSDDLIRLTKALESFDKFVEDALRDINSCNSFYQEEKERIKIFFENLQIKIEEKKKDKLQKLAELAFENIFSEEKVVEDFSQIAWALEIHYVAQKYETYLKKKKSFEECQKNKEILGEKLKTQKAELKVLKEKVKSTHIPKKYLNDLLQIAFPYKDIQLDDSTESIGYVLTRGGTKCNLLDLSEGERNFLALAYFLIVINTKEDDKKLSEDGIVVIDDPVSSLDSDSLFHIYSILLGEIETNPSRQYFILSHNLDFFGHLLRRFKQRDCEELDNFYQIKLDSSGSCISKLDDKLSSYNSDYRYTISKLNELKECDNINDQIFVANLLRRALETFLHFKYGTGDLFSKTELAYNRYIEIFMKLMDKATESDKASKKKEIIGKREMLYRFINYGSHEFLSIEKIDMSTLQHSKNVINDFFDLIKKIDEEHYKSFKI